MVIATCRRTRVVLVRLLDKLKWMRIDGTYYVNPDYVSEFVKRHGPLPKE